MEYIAMSLERIIYTLYAVYLVNNKFGELGRNAHWRRRTS